MTETEAQAPPSQTAPSAATSAMAPSTASPSAVSSPMTTGIPGPSPAYQVALDMLKRGAIAAPLLVALGAAVWGADGAAAVAYALGLVLVNFWLSAAIIAATTRISLALLMAGVLFGFLLRLGLIFLAVWLVREASWLDMFALGITIIITHLGLLVWELRYVSASLAFPGLKPRKAADPALADAVVAEVTD